MKKAINLNNEEVELCLKRYPEEIIKCLDAYFPVGNKARGKALVLQAVSYLEGKKQGKTLGINEERKRCLEIANRLKGITKEVDEVLDSIIKQISGETK